MNFHVASMGVTFNLGFPAGVWSCLNCSNKIIKYFPRLLSLLDFYKLNSFNN